MTVSEDHFFREATLRICGSLEVETFLYESFCYIRDEFPAYGACLTHYDRERKAQTALAIADATGGRFLNLSVPVPEAGQRMMEVPGDATGFAARADLVPPALPWIEAGLIAASDSIMWARLQVRGALVGAIIVTAKGSDRYRKQHVDRLSLLREPFAIALSNSYRFHELMTLKDRLAEDNRFLHDELRQTVGDQIVGADFGLRGVMDQVRQVAARSSPVLLLGETGTGKELVANAIHALSPRKDAPFIKVNCGAIPSSLMDSELFGHEQGAFTGAVARKRGRFERAHQGTIFLDEVGELPLEAQVRLLRVLQEKEIERVGGNEVVPLDIRIIAATHRDLPAMIAKPDGGFRDDLYFRLMVFPIKIPSLRERREDVPLLVQYLIGKKSRELGLRKIPVLAPGAMDRLQTHTWPGNVRELENAVERALITSHDKTLDFADIGGPETAARPVFPSTQALPSDRAQPFGAEDLVALDAVVSNHIRRVLDMAGGKVSGQQGAAELLEINPSTLRKRMRKLGIPFGRAPNKT